MTPADPSPWRRTRTLVLLGTLAGTAGAVAGFGLGWNGVDALERHFRHLLQGRDWNALAAVSFVAMVVSLITASIGLQRPRPFHAVKAAGSLGVAAFGLSWWLGQWLAGVAG